MAPTVTVEEQFQFLISCIRYSNKGKINFEDVAKVCNIVSKGAAAKRYERLMKAHGLNSSTSATSSPSKARTQDSGGDEAAATPAKRTAASKAAVPKATKRARKESIVASAERIVGKMEEGFDVKVDAGEDTAEA